MINPVGYNQDAAEWEIFATPSDGNISVVVRVYRNGKEIDIGERDNDRVPAYWVRPPWWLERMRGISYADKVASAIQRAEVFVAVRKAREASTLAAVKSLTYKISEEII